MSARRGAPANQNRRRASRPGRILIDSHSQAVPCRVRRLCADQAVITVDGWMGIPSRFRLLIEPGRAHHACRVVSRKGNCAQVELTADADAA